MPSKHIIMTVAVTLAAFAVLNRTSFGNKILNGSGWSFV